MHSANNELNPIIWDESDPAAELTGAHVFFCFLQVNNIFTLGDGGPVSSNKGDCTFTAPQGWWINSAVSISPFSSLTTCLCFALLSVIFHAKSFKLQDIWFFLEQTIPKRG